MPNKIEKQYTGGGVNSSIDPKGMAYLKKLGADSSVVERIGELLGRYRLMQEGRDTTPTVSESIRHIKQTQLAMADLLNKLELMPEDFKSLATDDYHRLTSEMYEQVEDRITTELRRYMAVCDKAILTMKSWPPTKGETPKYLEHKLLAGVAEILAPYATGKEDAAEKSSTLLNAADIKFIPVDKKKARRAILAYQKKTKTPR